MATFAWDSMHRVTRAQNDALRRRGFRLAIPGATHPGLSTTYALNCADSENLLLGCYAVPRVERGDAWVDRAYEHTPAAHRQRLAFLALDCETDAAANEDRIHQALERLRDYSLPPLIYTAYWWWVGHFGNNQAFGHTWLWNALYDFDEDFDFPSLSYGGWALERVAMEQYRGTHTLEGAVIDANVVAPAFLRLIERSPVMAIDEQARADIVRARQLATASGIFAELAAKALKGEQASDTLKAQARAILGP